MHPLLNIEINQISIAERIQLAEDLWDSVLSNPESLPITDNQKQELDYRLESYRQNPEIGTAWHIVKERLGDLQ